MEKLGKQLSKGQPEVFKHINEKVFAALGGGNKIWAS